MSTSPDNSFDPQDGPENSEIRREDAAPREEAESDSQAAPVDDSAAEKEAGAGPEAGTEGSANTGSVNAGSANAEQPADDDQAGSEPVAEQSPIDEPAAEKKPAAKRKNRGPIEEVADEPETASEDVRKEWYILKVQSNREKSICSNLIRRVKMAGLEDQFGEILVPTEDLVEYKNGKKKVTKQKLYPGYIVVHMAINDDTWFLVRETAGIGDFTGAGGKPVPMLPHEVDRIIKKTRKPEEGQQDEVKTNIRFKIGDHVRITEGTFENFEGDVEVIDETNGRVTVMINIFGRTTPVEMEHWQMEPV